MDLMSTKESALRLAVDAAVTVLRVSIGLLRAGCLVVLGDSVLEFKLRRFLLFL